MNDNLTHGLTLLADEAKPANIDSYDVIAKAKARTRNRRATAGTAFATLAAVGALAFTVGAGGGGGPAGQTVGAGQPSESVGADAPSSGVPLPKDPELAERLTKQLADAEADVIPTRWQALDTGMPNEFECTKYDGPTHFAVRESLVEIPGPDPCGAYATYRDAKGTIEVRFNLSDGSGDYGPCVESTCVERELPDGTKAQVTAEDIQAPPAGGLQTLTALRPDGTLVTVHVFWHEDDRTSQALTEDELFRFASVLSYRD